MAGALLLCLLLQDTIGPLVDRLGSDLVEERDDAERRLDEIGTATIPALERAAASSDAELALRADRLLRIQRVRVRLSPALRREVPDAESRVLKEGDRAWGKVFMDAAYRPALGREDLEPILIPALESEPGAAMREEICTVAASRDCRARLADVLRCAKGVSFWSMTDRATRWFDELEAPPDGSDLVPLLRDEWSRLLATLLLRRRPFEQIRPALRLALRDSDPGAREAALALIRDLDGRGETARVADCLRDSDGRVRALAVSILGRWKVGGMAGPISRMLKDGDVHVAYQAVCALKALDARDHLGDLISGLRYPAGPVQLEALRTLTEWEGREAAPLVLPLIGDSDPYLHEAAIQFVVRMGVKEAAPWLSRLLGSPHPSLRRRALDALKALEASDQAPMVAGLLGDPHPLVRAGAAAALVKMGARECFPRLIGLLRDEDAEVVSAAVEAVMEVDGPAAVPALAEMMASEDGFRRSIASGALEAIGGMEVVEALVALLEKGGLESRIDILRHFERTHAHGSVPALVARLDDPQWEVAVTAARALVHLDARGAAPRLLRMLGEEEGQLRREAIWALGWLGSRDAAGPLADALEDPDAESRARAATALGRLGVKTEALEKRLCDDEMSVRVAAAEALGPGMKEASIGRLLLSLDKDGTQLEMTWGAARQLCRLGSDRGVWPLLDCPRSASNGFFPLNAVREPRLWARLRETMVSGPPGPSAAKALEALAACAGLEVEDASEGALDLELVDPPCCWRNAGAASILDAIETLVTGATCEVVLDEGRLRVLTRDDALRFWHEWAQGK